MHFTYKDFICDNTSNDVIQEGRGRVRQENNEDFQLLNKLIQAVREILNQIKTNT